MGLILGVIILGTIALVAYGAAKVLTRLFMGAGGPNPSDRTPPNPNANNPDALEADLDPEGDEPEGY